jgi:hypothetical protein
MELIKPRLAMDSAERTKLETRSGQNSEEAGVVLGVVADEAGVVRWRYCAMPILKTLWVVMLTFE